MHHRLNLYTTVSTTALLLSIGAAAAQDWSPTSINLAPITLQQFEITDSSGITTTQPLAENIASIGVNASVSGSASGAVASVQLTGANAVWGGIPVGGIPDVDAEAINSGNIQAGAPTTISFDDRATLAAGASTQISTTGATASFSATGAGTADFLLPNVDSITLTADNEGSVENREARFTSPTAVSGERAYLSGEGSSMSATASGAVANTALRAVNADSFAAAPGTTVGDVTQTAENRGSIENVSTSLGASAVTGDAASISVGASGAGASLSLTGINSTYGGITVGDIEQTALNSGNVRSNNPTINPNPGTISGVGASVSNFATGASVGVGETMINSDASGSTVGEIEQTARLTGTAQIDARFGNSVPNAGEVSGTGASAGTSVSGAQARVSSTAITSSDFTGSSFGDVDQTVSTESGTLVRLGLDSQPTRATRVSSNGLSGLGASASVGVSGASASVGSALLASAGEAAQFSVIEQASTNAASVDAFAPEVQITQNTVTAGITGTGASAQIGLSGASTSVSATNLESNVTTGAQFVGGITGNAQNTGTVESLNAGLTTTALSGTGSSASITLSGASASVSEMNIAGTQAGRNEIRGVVDLTANNTANITNEDSELTVQTTGASPVAVDITGLAASARIGAVGASANMSSSVIEGVSGTQLRAFGPAGGGGPTQMDADNTGSVFVTGANLTAGSITGVAASTGIFATGASSAVSGTVIATPTLTQGMNLARLGQAAENDAPISVADSILLLGDLSGTASSASVGASGAVATVAFSGIGNGMAGSLLPQSGDAVSQNVVNNGNISVDTSPVTVGTLSGNASSASISVRGASGSIAVSSIELATQGETTRLGGNLVQEITNNGSINASGNISAAGLTGVGASIAVSAVGAAANVSVSSINDAMVIAPVQVASITQNVTNTAPVVTAGSVNVGGAVSGLSSSVSVSAVGASSVVSFSSIATP